MGWDYGESGTKDNMPMVEYLPFLQEAIANIYTVTRPGGVLCLNLPPSIRLRPQPVEARAGLSYHNSIVVPLPRDEGERAFPLAAWAELEMRRQGWLLRESIEWIKSKPGATVRATTTAIGNYVNPFIRHCRERIIIGSKEQLQIPNRSPRWPGDNEAWQSYLELCKDAWLIEPGRSKKGTPLQFPWKLVANLVYLYSNPGDLVMDPFAGTGQTGSVARKMQRECLLIEQNPELWDDLDAVVSQTMLHESQAPVAPTHLPESSFAHDPGEQYEQEGMFS